MSTVNLVKYYFYKGTMPKNKKTLQQMIALAYQTARDRKLHPKAVLIRSGIHDTTSVNGIFQKDPLGWHLTLCFKDLQQLASGTHVASHGYVETKHSFDLIQATHAGEKPDWVTKSDGDSVWPSEESLIVAPEIGYGHFPEQSGLDEPGAASISASSWQIASNANESSTAGFTSYSAASSTSYLLPDDTPFVTVKVKHGTYRFVRPEGGEVKSTAADWEYASIMWDGQVCPCVFYTGKNSGKKWYAWELPAE